MVDYLGFRKKIGIVIPSTNTTCQPESEALRPEGVTNHVARISIIERPLNVARAIDARRNARRRRSDHDL
jgi:maleate isomerase